MELLMHKKKKKKKAPAKNGYKSMMDKMYA